MIALYCSTRDPGQGDLYPVFEFALCEACMYAPNFANRSAAEIVMNDVTFDSAGYVYRGLSWLDFAKRHTSVCGLQYAALETRQAIEQLLFEELVMSVGGKLDRRDYEKCKGNSTKMTKIIRKLSPEYDRLVFKPA